ncbi:hypothetical protein ISS99_16315 [Dyella mobilis]|uniref:Secreted protein n=2 Tax=Dyella mobilis TaxID=1849582 RepID=A0ABS2KJ73_9GAMM|nr:hypothetical protein [Dyella mobilis]
MSRAVVTVGLVLGLSGAAWAGAPATGLGQQWPNATDLSRSPHYHVYAFVQNGVRFIQVNSSNGTVLGAIGTAGGQYIVLPMGNALQVSTPQQSATTSSTAVPAASPTTVYNDGTTAVTATPMSDGTTALVTSDICSDPASCGSHAVKQVQ